MSALDRWKAFLDQDGPEHQSLNAALLAKEPRKLPKPCFGITDSFDGKIRWSHWVELPTDANFDTPLGLYCEKGYVIPLGPARMHTQMCHDQSVTHRGFMVHERGTDFGPIEMHAKTCTCTLKVKPCNV